MHPAKGRQEPPNQQIAMKSTSVLHFPDASLWCSLFLGASVAVSSWAEGSMFKPRHATPGGLRPEPFLYSVERTEEGVTLHWQGLTPPYQVEAASGVVDPVWQVIAGPVAGESLTLPADQSIEIFRVAASAPIYLGAKVCGACHYEKHQEWQETRHAGALETLKRIGMDKNQRCLQCHTVGLGLPTGFVSSEQTPQLGGVQCENCHGPGGQHIANLFDPSMRPKVTLAAETCGGCHTDAHHPTYDEWLDSGHAHMNEHVADYFLTRGESMMSRCGACHSGAVRLAMLERVEALADDPAAEIHYPTPEDAAYFTVECVVCHDAHADAGPHQLRNPTSSLENFSYQTSVDFAEQYNPDIQLCAQCHNMRGASWEDTSRPPHHSPQYNMLIGMAGYDPDGQLIQRAHTFLEDQCAHCHTHAHEVPNPTEETPNYTGHTFRPTFEGCAECHGSAEIGELLAEGARLAMDRRIAEVKALLDEWAATRAPEELRAKYGALAWEYTNVGELSNPGGEAVSGPDSDEQTLIPDVIKQARFNLYLVARDASGGVHNGAYARRLLQVAAELVQGELNAP